ncbi:MAG: hypothetical protein EOO07_24875, partial [Chitinophagaceae bacterium]
GLFEEVDLGKYQLKELKTFLTGIVSMTTDGSAFIIPDDEFEKDIYIAPRKVHTALNGDKVKIYVYADVSDITSVMKVKAPNGNILTEPHTIIRFKDGVEWSTRSDGFEDVHKNQEIIDLVVAKTKKQITRKEFAD